MGEQLIWVTEDIPNARSEPVVLFKLVAVFTPGQAEACVSLGVMVWSL